MSTEWRELKTIEDFNEVKKSNKGFIVITDNRGNKVHKPWCGWIKADNFIKKVIMNNCYKGNYYWISDRGADMWNATSCCKCI